jgi:hypothetical protein
MRHGNQLFFAVDAEPSCRHLFGEQFNAGFGPSAGAGAPLRQLHPSMAICTIFWQRTLQN